MKYFRIIPIFGILSYILARFSFHAPIYNNLETKFGVSVCESVCVHTHTHAQRGHLRNLVKRYLKGFLKDLKAIFF